VTARKPDPQTLAAAQRALEQTGSSIAASKITGIPSSTIRTWNALGWLSNVTAEPAPIEKYTPRQLQDAVFWRRQASEATQARLHAEHLAEMLAGIRDAPVDIPEWPAAASHGAGRSVVGCLLSDIHMGEVIDSEELLGINAFNVEVCRSRLRRYFDAACIIGKRWASDTDCQGVLLALAGDLTSGDIHEELRITNALTAVEQVTAIVAELTVGIETLRDRYGRVHVVGVPGNHGRTTLKPTAKLYARLSYDILVCSMLEERFKGDTRVTWQFGRSTDQVVPIFGRAIMVTHGDKIGTKGGMGFAGPNLPIIRGAKKVMEQQGTVDRRPDLILIGHYHTTTNPGNVLANGSVPGYSEFANDIRAVVEPPQQWLFLLHDRWGLRERMPIQLEEPRPLELPRVRVPATMA
jgi:hypothetical protein